MKEKLKKISGVIFLTLLIWFWAYMALEQVIQETGTLNVAPSSPDIHVQFDREVPIRLKLEIKGPASKVTEFRRKLYAKDDAADKEKLDFFFNAEKEDMATPETHKLNVLQFLRKDENLKRLGLTVESCDVETVDVTVEQLKSDVIPIQCLNENGDVIKHLSIDPPRVRMFIPQDWTKEEYIANVTLTSQQIEQARKSSVVETPYIELSASTTKKAETTVEIKLPPTEEPLSERPLQALPSQISFVMNRNMHEKYRAKLLNESDLTSKTSIMASDTAWAEFKRMPYHILIEVRSGDETAESEITREAIYNFPVEYISKKEIRLNEPPRRAKFKLVPRSAVQTSP